MPPSKKRPPGDDEKTGRLETGQLRKLRRESRSTPLPSPEDFEVTTNPVSRELMEQLRQRSRSSRPHSAAAPPAAPSLPDQPVIESLEEWSAATSGEFSIDLDLDELAELTPLTPPQQSVLRFPTATRAGEGAPVMAIDLGTSFSVAAVLQDDQVVLLPRPRGSIPSVVGVREDGFTVVGEDAREMRISDPANVIASPKRLLGRSYGDPELQGYLADLGMLAVEGQAGEIMVRAHRQLYSMEQICATLIYRLRLYASELLGHDVTDAVFTIPVSFDTPRTAALTRAAAIAGVNVLKVLEEPAAAALAYRNDPRFRGLVAVYDFGGGTFDFSVVDVGSGLTVVATAGDTWLGGDDIDEVLASAVADAFWRQKGIELRNQAVEWQRLLARAEETKRELSTSAAARLELTNVARTAEGALDVSVTVTRAQLTHLVQGLVERSLETCAQALELSSLSPAALQAVFMSGGSSFVPAVLEGVARFFGQIPLISVPPDKAVVLGAAEYVRLLGELRAQA